MTPSETIRATITEDGVVLLDVENGNIFSSNGVGAQIWLKMQERLSPLDIAEQLAAEFSIPAEQLLPDVEHFINQLKENGVVI